MIRVRQVFHVATLAYYVVMSHWIQEIMSKNRESEPGIDPAVLVMQRFSIRYLTNWTFTLQVIFFTMAFVDEILALVKGLEKVQSKLNKFKSYFFTVLVAPMALTVTISFWSFWLVDRELIFPRSMDKVLPPWVNHALHTTTSVLVLLEMCVCSHKYPAFKRALLGITLYLVLYCICLVGTYFQNDVWLYPVMKILSWPLRISMFLAVYILAIAIYGVCYFINKVLWGEIQTSVKSQQKKKTKKH